ncbi:S41 family peptidase [Acidipila sp. EB88]|uniref:S41 family peptidase n=1 Tax=Acidipila sp. EB88 TaxID=2305226 RepID=UPI001F292FD8|nr:S41 family peptidase [Acidipila sp. EB88]
MSVTLALVVLLGGSLPPSVRAGGFATTDGAYKQMGVYEEVLRKIQNFYVVQPSLPAVTDGALHGLLESLDSDSSYLTAGEYKAYKAAVATAATAGNAEQVGLHVSKRYGYATVVSVMPGSQADKQGLQDGDVIEAVDGKSTHDLPLAMIRLLLEGKAGTSVSLDVIVPGKDDPVNKKLQRGAVPVPALATQQYDGTTILYLKPVVLTKERVTEIEAQLRGMGRQGNKKVLLDLRDVSSGDELQGVRLANAFVQSGTIASLSGQKFPTETYTAEADKFVTSAPLVVLTNRGTAGAAEIVAAAILGAKRGDLVGDRTFGEGTVQHTMDMPGGAALLLTVAKYNGPDGKPIQENPVKPTVQVNLSIDQFLAEQDETAAQPSHPAVDDQLNKALDVLKAKQS